MYKKFRWSQVYESSEEEIIDFMEARNITAERIHATADEDHIMQQAEIETTIWCAEGSFVIKTATTDISLQPGDAIHIEAGSEYTVIPGFADCVYYLSR